jgi:hypothetical protein
MITMDLWKSGADEGGHMVNIIEPLLLHICHTIVLIPSQVSTFVATKNLMISIPWFC